MFKIKVLNHDVIEEILGMKEVIEVVEKVYTLKSEEKTELFPMVFHEFERGIADMDIKSGHLKGIDIFGLKLVTWFGENHKKNLPPLIGTIMVFDSKTGKPLGILNAEYITGMRTGAAGAIGAKYLARKDSENLLMIGTGHISTFQIAATLIAMDNIKTVRIYDPINHDNARKLSESIKETLMNKFLSKYEVGTEIYKEINEKFDIYFEAVNDIKEAVSLSDVIITATPSRKPLIMKKWVKKGTHFSCVGADMEGKQEIDENIFGVARVYVDDINQAVNVGETEIPVKKGIITKENIIAEIGDVITERAKGRISDDDITIYDTTGIALQDLLTSKLVLDISEEKGLGVEVNL
ncbi:ornithine cyclodeaminase family protein [Paramaledivibacter caminithermalis]|jgi:ornithine cyclodeaminase/alanine dehydrogenase|uniref:Ornithine cyclodeaminase n=1 Tax=Paramaledivibacter caminithermalis (strain DSM 15212 / CIP 107654 / DViRD3) TaxID=1121301 RepID=A0A1M6RHX1_PARC5|nr:ornithine cyclodeaminase family protein [Paramaledivibacter caminithermalis]SHK32111.1 ornithine cyclodeaminase [Paramaledivibacter caminithermalis DSM 15212]